MSSDEYWNGNLRKVEFSNPDLTWNEKIQELISKGWDIDVECSEEDRYIEENGYFDRKSRKPFLKVINSEIYEIYDYSYSWDESYYATEVWDNGDGTVGFFSSFYNSGTSLSEQLDDAMKDFKIDKSKHLYCKDFCGEELGEMGNDLYFNLHDICKDLPNTEGIPHGTFTLTLKWIEEE